MSILDKLKRKKVEQEVPEYENLNPDFRQGGAGAGPAEDLRGQREAKEAEQQAQWAKEAAAQRQKDAEAEYIRNRVERAKQMASETSQVPPQQVEDSEYKAKREEAARTAEAITKAENDNYLRQIERTRVNKESILENDLKARAEDRLTAERTRKTSELNYKEAQSKRAASQAGRVTEGVKKLLPSPTAKTMEGYVGKISSDMYVPTAPVNTFNGATSSIRGQGALNTQALNQSVKPQLGRLQRGGVMPNAQTASPGQSMVARATQTRPNVRQVDLSKLRQGTNLEHLKSPQSHIGQQGVAPIHQASMGATQSGLSPIHQASMRTGVQSTSPLGQIAKGLMAHQQSSPSSIQKFSTGMSAGLSGSPIQQVARGVRQTKQDPVEAKVLEIVRGPGKGTLKDIVAQAGSVGIKQPQVEAALQSLNQKGIVDTTTEKGKVVYEART